MRYVAAYLLAVMGGNRTPSRGDLEKILSSVGIEGESDKFEKVIKELAGKDVKQVIEQGKQKLSTVSGGAVVAAPAASAGGGGGAAPAAGGAPTPAKKEEKKEEPKEEESDEDMGFGLFD